MTGAPLTPERCEELAMSLFREFERLDPGEQGDFDEADWGWSRLTRHDRHLYRCLVSHMLAELGIKRTYPMIDEP